MMAGGGGPQLPWPAVGAVVLGSLAGSGFFSGTETGLMSASRIRLHLLARRRPDPRLERLQEMLRNPADPILTCLVGTNLMNVLGSAVLTGAVSPRYGHAGEAVAAVVMTVLTIVLAEIVPKLLWREYPEALTLRSVRPLRAAMTLLTPVRWLLLAVSGWLTRRLAPPASGTSARERTAALLRSRPGAPGDRLYREMLDRCLELEALDLRRLMTPLARAVTLPADATVRRCRETAVRTGFSRIPLVRDGRVAGWLLVRDLLLEEGLDPDAPLPPRLVRDCPLVDVSLSPWALFEELRWQRHQMAVVVDGNGNPLGLVTLEDLLEVLVGAIEDEFDATPAVAGARAGR